MGQEDIPDEQGIGYSPMKYVMGVKAILEPKNYPPSSFVKVEKSQYHEGWLLLLTCTSPPEYKVLYTHQKKYGMLVDKVFYVFDEDKLHLRQPLLTLNFDLNCFYIEESDKKSLEFKIIEASRRQIFIFNAETYASKDAWLKYLALHLKASCGVREKLFKLSGQPRFWESSQISPDQLVHIANHGDVLLFHTDNAYSTVQRFFTSSEFAMLLRAEDGSIIVLEALGGTGVELNEWSKFIARGWYKIYKRICYRKLTCRRDGTFNQAMSDFIRDNEGKKYEITFQKLMKMNSLIDQGSVYNAKQYESFFCSELVAAAWKACGLISTSKSCSQYWPVTFSDREQIDFLKGAKLEAQMDINFEL